MRDVNLAHWNAISNYGAFKNMDLEAEYDGEPTDSATVADLYFTTMYSNVRAEVVDEVRVQLMIYTRGSRNDRGGAGCDAIRPFDWTRDYRVPFASSNSGRKKHIRRRARLVLVPSNTTKGHDGYRVITECKLKEASLEGCFALCHDHFANGPRPPSRTAALVLQAPPHKRQ